MHRAATLITTLVLLLTLSLHTAIARQATPAAAGASGPDVGATISVLGTEGTEVATVTVTELTDPFDDYDPNSPPDRGFHFVLLTVTISNTGTRPYEANPSHLSLVDADGFVYDQGGLYRGSDPAPPDLQHQNDLAPRAEATGAIGFQVLNGVEVAQVVYAPDSDRLITLLDRRTDLPALGDTVPFLGTEGTEVGQITIADLADPFADYDPGSPPQRGSHYVLVTATITNTGPRPLEADPNDLYLVDTDGFSTRSTSVRRADNATPPDFEYQRELAAGSEATGVIAYEVLNGTTPVSIVYVPDNDRQITAAVLGATGSPRPTPRPNTTTVTPAARATATATSATTSNADCDAIVAWFNPTNDRFNQITAIVNGLPALDTATAADLPAIRKAAAAVAALAEEQRNSQPPPEAEAFNNFIVDYLTNIGKGLDFFADGLEAGDPAQQLVAIANLGEFDQKFQTDGLPLYNELVALCPG